MGAQAPTKLSSSLVPTLNIYTLTFAARMPLCRFCRVYSIVLYTECSVVKCVINHNGFFGCWCATPKTKTEEEERRKRIYFGLFSYHLSSEVKEARGYLAKQTDLEDLSDVIVRLLDVEKAFPELLELLAIALTFGVSTASCERSFSCLKILKTYLRATMREEQLNSLALLSIERDVSETLELDKAIDIFSSVDKTERRLQLLPSNLV